MMRKRIKMSNVRFNKQKNAITLLIIISLIMSVIFSGCYIKQGKAENAEKVERTLPQGSWTMWRSDTANTGIQMLSGAITYPVHTKDLFLKGVVTGEPVFADIDGDDVQEIFFLDSGKVVAVNQEGNILWTSNFILANRIYSVEDLDNDEKKEVLVFGEKQLIILNAHTGEVLYKEDFQDQVSRPRFLLHDFDKDGCKEAVIWIYSDTVLYVYKFSNDNGKFIAKRINTIDGSMYQIEAYYPGLLCADTNNDGYDEFILVRYRGISIYDAKTLSSKEGQGTTPIATVDYIPEGADNGRFYGYFTMTDVNQDRIPDGVIVADGVSMHVGVMKGHPNGNITKMWDKYYGYSSQPREDGKCVILKVVNDAVTDAEGDGRPHLVYSVFEYADGSAIGTWTFKIINAQNYNDPENVMLEGYYLWAVENIGNGNPLFFLSKENTANPVEPSAYEVFTFNKSGNFEKVFTLPYSLPKKMCRELTFILKSVYTPEALIITVDNKIASAFPVGGSCLCFTAPIKAGSEIVIRRKADVRS